MKKIIPIILILIIIISCCGCVNSDKANKYSSESQIQMAKDLLRDKYGEEFEISAIGGRYGSIINTTYKVKCYPVNNSKLLFEAEIAKDGSYLYDEYLSKIVCSKLTDAIVSKIDFKAEFFIRSRPSNFETNDTSLTIDEFISQNEGVDFVIWMICTNEIEEKDILNQLEDVLSSFSNLNGELRYCITDNEDEIDKFRDLSRKATEFSSDMRSMFFELDEQEILFKNNRFVH